MSFSPAVVHPGDVISSREWNAAMAEILRLRGALVGGQGPGGAAGKQGPSAGDATQRLQAMERDLAALKQQLASQKAKQEPAADDAEVEALKKELQELKQQVGLFAASEGFKFQGRASGPLTFGRAVHTDTHKAFDGTTYKVPLDGLYVVHLHFVRFSYAGGTQGDCCIMLRINGASQNESGRAGHGTRNPGTCTYVLQLKKGDSLQVVFSTDPGKMGHVGDVQLSLWRT